MATLLIRYGLYRATTSVRRYYRRQFGHTLLIGMPEAGFKEPMQP